MFNNMKMTPKLIIPFGIITLIVTLGLGMANYHISKNSIRREVLSNLTNSTHILYNSIQASIHEAVAGSLHSPLNEALELVEKYYKRSLNGELGQEKAKKMAADALSSFRLAQGLVLYSVDKDGVILASQDRKYVGMNLIRYEQVQLQLQQKNGVFEANTDLPWDDSGRPRMVYTEYFEPWGWSIAVSGDSSRLKANVHPYDFIELLSSVYLGEGGYAFIINSRGDVVLHPTLSNTNVYESVSTDGSYFIKTMCSSGSGQISYKWKGPNDREPRSKIVQYERLSEMDWIIACGVYENEVFGSINSLGFVNIVIVLLSLGFITIVAVFFARSILKMIHDINRKLSGINSGKEAADLTRRIEFESRDEIGDIARGVNRLLSNLNGDILQVSKVAGQIDRTTGTAATIAGESVQSSIDVIKKSAQGIGKQTEDASSGVEELTSTLEEMSRNIDSIIGSMERQASAVEEGASSIEEMVRNIENTSLISGKTREISGNLNNVASEGGVAVKKAIGSIKEVAEYSQQILKMLQLITNIAKQTNLLAMNASIEAAHAGEAGKGFAIVADEIRRMSEDTNKNAREIGDVVNSIVNRIGDSVKLAEKAGIGLDMILAYSTQTVQVVSQLNITMDEQKNGAKEVLKATQELVQITEEVQLSMKEQKSATDEFFNALKEIRDLSLSNKQMIQEHFQSLTDLIQSIEAIKGALDKNVHTVRQLTDIVGKYKVVEEPTEATGLRLAE